MRTCRAVMTIAATLSWANTAGWNLFLGVFCLPGVTFLNFVTHYLRTLDLSGCTRAGLVGSGGSWHRIGW